MQQSKPIYSYSDKRPAPDSESTSPDSQSKRLKNDPDVKITITHNCNQWIAKAVVPKFLNKDDSAKKIDKFRQIMNKYKDMDEYDYKGVKILYAGEPRFEWSIPYEEAKNGIVEELEKIEKYKLIVVDANQNQVQKQ